VRPRPGLLAASAAVLVTVLAAALVPPAPAEAVARWFGDYLDVAYVGDARHASFLAPDVLLDDRALSYDRVSGRYRAITETRTQQSTHGPVGTGSVYVDATGAAALQTVTPVDRGVCETETPLLRLVEVGPAGLSAETLLPSTLTSGAACVAASTGEPQDDDGATRGRQVASAWVRAWDGGPGPARRGLYAPDAVVVDTLHGVDLRSRDELLDAPALTQVSLDRVGGHHRLPTMTSLLPAAPQTPAVYLGRVTPLSARLDQVWFAAHADGRAVLVGLHLDPSGRVVAERRMRDPADVGRSVPAGKGCCQDFWWDGREPPVPLTQRRTPVPLGGVPVDVVNSTPALVDDLRWAVGRFTLAGLPVPSLRTVVFDPYDPRCVRDDGRTTVTAQGTTVLVCSEQGAPCRAQGCDPMAERRMLLLHELGHAWLGDHLDAATRDRFQSLVGTPRWSEQDADSRRLGVEWAAETLAWGLDGDPNVPLRVGAADCATLRAGFVLLTGTSSNTRCQLPE
jgi:hypothetical protein